VNLFGVDQPFRFGHALLGLGLGIGINHLDLGAPQRLDAAGGVDFLDGQITRALALLSHRGGRSRKGFDVADLDHLVGGKHRRGIPQQADKPDNRNHHENTSP